MLKDYSLQVKKNIAVFLHIIFLTLAIFGISIISLNTKTGLGISSILKFGYDDSILFQERFQKDLDQVFQYISYRDVFETDGSLNLSKEMFSISRANGPEVIYTLEEVLRYAKSQGFYLNDKFEVVSELFLYDHASTAKDQLVNWRAYPTDQPIREPGDAYTSLLDLSKEVLNCLSAYYSVYYRMIVNPSNFQFQISYQDNGDEIITYTNCEDLSVDQLCSTGRYCYLDSDSIFIDTNLLEIPRNITVSIEENNFYDAPYYYIAASVDTSYPADDGYARAAADYQRMKDRLIEGLAALSIGILGCLSTLYYLVLASGYRNEDRTNPQLHNFDMISTEGCIALTGICTLFMLFIGEKIGFQLIHLLLNEEIREFAEKMMRAMIIYACCMAGAFSLLRRYKTHQLWENSIFHKIKIDLDDYFAHRSFSYRLFCLYAAFVCMQTIGVACICIFVYSWKYPLAKAAAALLAMALAALDYRTYHAMFSSAVQEDRIAEAIKKIASGDTSYQMEIDGLKSKELMIANQINQIGTGLERALQEQVKSERLKADLITNVSHDIKTPLTSIINYVDLIKRENIQNPRLQEYLSVLEQKSQRLKILTEDLVEASKASSGNLKLDMASLDLVEMIWQTNGEFEEKYAARHLELVSALPESSMMIHADGRHLWRVLENLYNNAYKYAMANSRVYTEVSSENGMAWFTIKNMSEHPLNISSDELTERFVRGDVSRTTEGSGLGLSIAQSLTKLQGGSFELFIDGDLFKARVGFPLIQKPNAP